MTSREFSDLARVDPKIKRLLATLVAPGTPVGVYRAVMQELGELLAAGLLHHAESIVRSAKDVCVVCTVEDADYLAKGVLDGLRKGGISDERLYLQCFWNEKVRENGISLSPIVRQYEESFDHQQIIYVVVKSIISGACVVKTNLTRVLSKSRDAEVFVVSPVLLHGAQNRLENEFPESMSRRFNYVWFATDFEKNEVGDVMPGIGGSVYERLGLGVEQNNFVPKIVRERREKRFGVSVGA